MKYFNVYKLIDAEKLIAEIERRKKEYIEFAQERGYSSLGNAARIRVNEDVKILSIITSLQQEQPVVDLGEEVRRWKNKHGVVGMDDLWLKFAHHIYELGLNARKK